MSTSLALSIPMEVADGITIACLKEQRKYLKQELKDHKTKQTYLHIDDKASNEILIECLDMIIDYYGG